MAENINPRDGNVETPFAENRMKEEPTGERKG